MTPELDALLGGEPWVRDAAGCLVQRQELTARIREELVESYEGDDTQVLEALAERIRSDKRKTISKAKIIEMIEEWT